MTKDITTNLPQLVAALSQFNQAQVNKLGERAGLKIGLELEKVMKRSPGPPNYPLKWTAAERRAYFAMRRARNLPVKYTRISDPMSEKLEQRWSVQRVRGGAVVGNPASYAAKVQSDQHQTPMHADTGWTTDKQAVEQTQSRGLIRAHVMAEVKWMVEEAFRGMR